MCVCMAYAWGKGRKGRLQSASLLAFRMFLLGEGILHGSDNALVLVGVFM